MKNFIIAAILIESSVFHFLSMNKEMMIHAGPFFKHNLNWNSWGIDQEPCKKLPVYDICKEDEE